MIEVILSIGAVIALLILAAAVLLRMMSQNTVDAEEQFDYCDTCASEPAPLDDVFRKNGAI